MTRNFALKFEMDNDAFSDGAEANEAARILRDIADKIERGRTGGTAADINGNTVGKWEIDGERAEGYADEGEDE